MSRRQKIPFHHWGYRISTVAQRNAIVDPLIGSFAYVSDDDDLFQWDGAAWQLVTSIYSSADSTKVGFIAITQAVNLDQIETDTVANNAKVTNATHTGEVTGSGALTVDKTAITNKTLVTADALDHVLISDASDTDNLKKILLSDLLSGVSDHGGLAGLGDDDHTIYALLLGRAGSQVLSGGNAANEDLTLNGTTHATKTTSYVLLQTGGGNVGINQSAPVEQLVVGGNTFIGANELVEPFTNYVSATTPRFIQVFRGTATSNANLNYADLNFVHDLTSVTGDKIVGGFKFINKSSGATEKRLAQFFCFAEGAVNKGAMAFYTHNGTTLAERFRITNAGRIGIGTTAPDRILEINLGTTDAVRLTYNDANGSAAIYAEITISSTGAVTFNAVGSGASFSFNDPVIFVSTARLKYYTVATLPAGVQGDIAFVTDALAPAYLTAVVGGGAVVTPVFYDGTNWVAH